ncbi:DUF262 and DUF1524 domain-containing protein [Thermoflavimicrobium dichotomicum]|uniref:Predicted transport protein n=1 Tax=Thermoflavimicrobium dichotomicum TaxID=46223 RepID=A0A1I3UDF3_9BACL|nr:DUF262 and DUF1524 domain-containing protein [Thermoflavimicrobium dichotomicum]SFJ79841.1 Predicted transport protein [Thermoflavimicrobium dichotomicum]
MKATETNFLDFMRGVKQFQIPIYQRTYSWNQKQCQQLWNDIERVARDESLAAHFLGSVVYIEKGLYQVTSIPQLLVIDGQQRLTTISLFLAAFADVISSGEKECTLISAKKIRNYYLFNADEEDEKRYKIYLTRKDREAFIAVIEGKELEDYAHTKIARNYQFFLEKLRKSKLTLDQVYQGLMKLIVVDIALDRDKDNPQLIFESLNSTGLDLSQADLIRNYFLMGLEAKKQERLYNDYWYKLEQKFDELNDQQYFDRFIRDYLTLKTGQIPNIGSVYESFKQYVDQNRDLSVEEIIKDIYKYGTFYLYLALRSKDPDIESVLQDIRTLKVDVAYPFLMEVYHDYDEDVIDKSEFLEILKLVESYVFRRAICGIPANSLNKTFAALYKEIDKEHYLESLKAAFLLKTSYRRFPTDIEFEKELKIKDIYHFRSRNYLLRKLENYGRKEPVQVQNYTVEHILPQNRNLSDEWKEMLGENWEEVQKTYLHTIGNLTLTGYNSELSDKPFHEKQNMEGGFKHSPLWLNRSLAHLTKWDEEEILKRAELLANRALEIWKSPQLPEEVLERYKQDEHGNRQGSYSLAQFQHVLVGSVKELFEQIRGQILELDSSVKEEVKKYYIAYKAATNFVDVTPQRSGLKLFLNLDLDEIHDPKEMCRDVSNIGHHGNGNVEVKLSSLEEIPYVMTLIRQAFEKHCE